jgi:hypothetical protein
MKLNLPVHSTRHFSVHLSDKLMIAEASNLTGKLMGQMYDDACDVGMAIHKDKTSKESEWNLVKTDEDNEDVFGWNFEPTAESIRKFPNLRGWTVLIIND